VPKLYDWLFRRVLTLDMSGDGPPWPVRVHNPDTSKFESVGIVRSPLLAPGPPRRAAVELVVFPADPPDAVTMAGDYVYLRAYEPDFTLSPQGDVTLMEGR
jgi:hypothetical protein